MADITWDDVVALAPELVDIAEAGQDLILAYVNEELDVSVFDGEDGPKTKLARIYLAAHFTSATELGSVGASGPVTSESVDGLSRSYAVSTTVSSGDFSSSSYGQAYLALVRTSLARAPIVL